MPTSFLGADPDIRIWGRCSLRRDGELLHVDRAGHPSVSSFFNTDDTKEEYNASEPVNDRTRWIDMFIHLMGHTGGYSREEAIEAIDKEGTLPDMLTFNPSKPAKYPNGRVFTDDVIDYRLAFLTKGECPPTWLSPHTDTLPSSRTWARRTDLRPTAGEHVTDDATGVAPMTRLITDETIRGFEPPCFLAKMRCEVCFCRSERCYSSCPCPGDMRRRVTRRNSARSVEPRSFDERCSARRQPSDPAGGSGFTIRWSCPDVLPVVSLRSRRPPCGSSKSQHPSPLDCGGGFSHRGAPWLPRWSGT